MLKKIVCVLSFLGSISLFALEASLPQMIDFGYGKRQSNYSNEAWKLGEYAFNGAPELGVFFVYVKKAFKIEVAIETGTFLGNTSVFFANLFNEVHTIEVQESTYQSSKEKLKSFPNVVCHLGSSEQVLNQLLASLKGKRILAYLDAHWESYWPLLDELEEIAKTHKDNCIVVIDDFKVPYRKDIPYDKYGSNECSYEYIKDQLKKVFTSYEMHYLIPTNPALRAKFVAIPSLWIKDLEKGN